MHFWRLNIDLSTNQHAWYSEWGLVRCNVHRNLSPFVPVLEDLLVHCVAVITSVLYTGDNVLERISPRVIVLDPPEKLVLETSASGGYSQFEWQRNGNPFMLAPGPFTITLQEFSNFFEVFVREPTTVNDLGVYEVELVGGQPQVPEIEFAVTPYSKLIDIICCGE